MPAATEPVKVDAGGARLPIQLVPWVIAALGLALWASRAVLDAAGGPALPLDDSYIHLQYARSFARLSPFEYTVGAVPTPGATSVLWPLALSPWVALGFDGADLVYVAWVYGWLALVGLAHETRLLARGLVGDRTAWIAGALVPAFSALTWFATSGMEVVPFAWLLTASARRAADTCEGTKPGRAERGTLVALAWLVPLCRPEGALASLGIAAALATRRPRLAGLALVSAAGAFAPNLAYALATASPLSSTALAKWLPLNPYVAPADLAAIVGSHAKLLLVSVLGGGPWTWIFLPKGAHVVAWLGLAATVVAGALTRRWARSAAVVLLALGALVPTTYETFLVNRLRYVWPFAAGWLVGVACLAEFVGVLVGRRLPAARHAGPALTAAAGVLLALRLPDALDDLGRSAAAIADQQVALGKWVADALPLDARVGVNDTGAIAYFGGRQTFDVVGLTTRSEARFWAAGAGARFEHYERLRRDERPTHFVVYRSWFDVDPLLGAFLQERTVHASILGGPTMSAYEADWTAVGSGAQPALHVDGAPLDELDVADLDSEEAHGYALLDATKERCVAIEHGGRVDGGRLERRDEQFRLALGTQLVLRVGAAAPTTVEILVDGQQLARATIPAEPWVERRLPLPAALGGEPRAVRVRALGGPFSAVHYWSYR